MKPDTPQIQLRAVSTLVPYERNARTHSADQITQIAASIREFGWTNPVLLDGHNGVIAGHARLAAARQLGLERVPCIELAHLTDAQKRAYILADNRLALNAGWDLSLLASELQELKAEDFNLDLLGFDSAELDSLLLSPAYCDVIVTRWQNFTGHKATLNDTKQTFDELKEARTVAA